MSKLVAACIVFIQLLAASQKVEAVTTSDLGSGTVYTLQVVKDVSLERSTTNFNYLEFLIVGLHQGYPRKRSLLQFEDLPSNCTEMHWAKMYLYYVYSHKASFQSIQQAPFISRNIEVHMVKKEWEESQATRDFRKTGVPWSQPYLNLNGTVLRKKCWIVSLSTQAVPEALLNLTLLKLFAAGRKVVPTMVL